MSSNKSMGLLDNKSFVIYLVVRFLVTVTLQMVAVAIGWQIYSITHSVFMLGMVGLVQFIPMLLFTLVVGIVADRFNRKVIISISQGLITLAFVILTMGSIGGWITEGWILTIVFFLGTANAFQGPAMRSMLPNIVEKEVFVQATAQSTSLFQLATIIGPALGGLLYAISPGFIYALCGFFSLISTISILFISVKQERVVGERVTLKSLFMGISFIKDKPIVLGAISLDLFAVLFGGATALLPVYADTILHIGSFGLGLLRSAPAIGALVMSFYLSIHPINRKVGRNMFIAVFVFGVSTIIFAVSTSVILSFIALIFLGASDVISMVVRGTLVQIETPDKMRGRVNSINQLFIGTSNQVGEFESGITAAWFGVIPAALIGGIGTIAVVLLWIKLFPSLYEIDNFTY